MDLSSINKFDRAIKAKRPYEYDAGNSNKYGKVVATKGHRILPNGSIVVKCTASPCKVSKRRRFKHA